MIFRQEFFSDIHAELFSSYWLCHSNFSSCGIADLLDDYEIDGINGLTLAYMFELGQEQESPWCTYLQSFKGESIPSLPRWWTKSEKELLEGTEIEFMGGLDEQEVIDAYENVIQPFMKDNAGYFPVKKHHTYEGYCEALVCVCSRGFEVDNYLGISLVPGADLFNHSDLENANFQCNPVVCPMCGEANYCEHSAIREMEEAAHRGSFSDENDDDYESISEMGSEEGDEEQNPSGPGASDVPDLIRGSLDAIVEEDEEQECEGDDELMNSNNSDGDTMSDVENPGGSSDTEDEIKMASDNEDGQSSNDDEDESDEEEEDEEDKYCDIALIRSVKKGEEIFNTYGDYGNAVLLSKYGFAIWDNTEESISVAPEVLWYAKTHNLHARLTWWKTVFYQCLYGIEPSAYDPEMFEAENEEEMAEIPPSPEDMTWHDTAEIISTGEATPGLLLVVAILSATPQKFALYKKRIAKGVYDCIPMAYGHKALTSIIQKRLGKYNDGKLTSKDYHKLLGKATGRSKIAITLKGTEKLILERALKANKGG